MLLFVIVLLKNCVKFLYCSVAFINKFAMLNKEKWLEFHNFYAVIKYSLCL